MKCVFCEIVKGNEKSWKVYEDKNTLAFFSIYPATKYHTLVIPKKHYENIFDTPAEELKNLAVAIKNITSLYKKKLGIENLQIINSSGPEAQQDIFHIHFHILPREKGDEQDIKWKTNPEKTPDFDELLKNLL